MWLSLLTNKFVIIGVIVVLAGIYITLLRGKLEVCAAEKNVLVAELSVSQASVKSLRSALDMQNLEIQKFKDEADKREAKHKAEIAKAKAKTVTSKKKADDILIAVVPQGKTTCDAANDLFNQEIKNAK